MKWYRIFFKDFGNKGPVQSGDVIERQAKKLSEVIPIAEKMGKKKAKRLVMIAEITKPSGNYPEKL